MTRIGIIIGSTRPGRNGEAVARWVYDIATKRDDAKYELVDIKDFDLPHLDELVPPSLGQYTQPHTLRVGREDRLVRRVRLRDAGVQPLHLRRAEERDRLPLRRVEQQGGGVRQLRQRRRHPGGGAPAPGRGRVADGRRPGAGGPLALHRLRELQRLQAGRSSGGCGEHDARPAGCLERRAGNPAGRHDDGDAAVRYLAGPRRIVT